MIQENLPSLHMATIALWPFRALRRGILHGISTVEITLGGLGLVAALVVAALLWPALQALPGAAGVFAPIGMTVLLAPIGIAVFLSRRPEVEHWLALLRERTAVARLAASFASSPAAAAQPVALPTAIVVDTSAIIDGRLVDVVEAGFVLSELLVPRFVLNELRRIADSPEALRRQRGRYGLEQLTRLQAIGRIPITIDEQEFPDHADVDAKILALARARGTAILTNDFNLNRVAGVEQLRVLNLNVLAQAVRTVVLPGESLPLQITQEGRERDQGVGFLDDGTMVVVEGGRRLLGQDVEVAVTRVIQTSAGRMIFADLPAQPPASEAAR